MPDIGPEYNNTFFLFCINLCIFHPYMNSRDILGLDCRPKQSQGTFQYSENYVVSGVSYTCVQILPWPDIIS